MDEVQSLPDREQDAGDGAPPTSRGRGLAHAGRWTWEWIKSLAVAFVLFLLIRTFAIEAFRIPTGSMESTLLVGDFLLVRTQKRRWDEEATDRRRVQLPRQSVEVVDVGMRDHDRVAIILYQLVKLVTKWSMSACSPAR